MKYIEIRFDDEGAYLVKPEYIGDYIMESLLNKSYNTITLSVVEMDEMEYEKLPEYEG